MILRGMVSVTLLGYSIVSGAASEAPFPVHEVQYQELEQQITLDAVVEAINVATVSSQVSGRVVNVNFDVDDPVRKGQVLVRLANREQRARVDEIEAKELEAAAQYNIDNKEFERVKQLYSKKLVSKSVLDQAEAKLRRAKEQLNSASARLKDAKTKLHYTVVRAPFSGVVVERHVEMGELARVGQPLMSGLSLKHLRVKALAPQRYIRDLRNNKQVRVSFSDQQPIDPALAVLTIDDITVSPQADPSAHSFIVRANLPEDSKGIYPGMFAKLSFSTGTQKRLLVPSQAIVNRSELNGVYVVGADNRLQLRQVRVGKSYAGERTEILAGLTAGERIALDPVKATMQLKATP